MIFNATFKYNSVMAVSLSVVETGVPGEPDKLDHIMLHQAQFAWAGFEHTTFIR
jgi:hypothetical protein